MNERIFSQCKHCILNLDKTEAISMAKKIVEEDIDILKAIELGYAKGLEEIGKKFEKGEVFLPELIRAAEVMESVMKILRPELTKRKQQRKSLGKVIIGTVEGDIHTIGKDIVAAMLRASGFEVVNLGASVPVRDFIDRVKKEEPDIVACSALLTTTMIVQRKIIEALIQEKLREGVKVIVGGAPVTEKWAEEIGADGYGKDAADAVKIAKQLLEL